MRLRAAEEHVLVVVGEADIATAGQLREQIVAALAVPPPWLRVELGGLDFCDLQGLDALHDAAGAAAAVGVPLQLHGMSPQLAWLHSTFLAASTPPTARQGAHAGLPEHDPEHRRTAQATAGTPDASTDPAATSPAAPSAATSPAAPPGGTQPRRARRSEPADAGAVSSSTRPRSSGQQYLTGIGGGRRATSDGLRHAVPLQDTTRSSVCGARVHRLGEPFDAADPASCSLCAAALVLPTAA